MLKTIVLTSVAAPPMGRDGGTRFKRGGAVHPLCWVGVVEGAMDYYQGMMKIIMTIKIIMLMIDNGK